MPVVRSTAEAVAAAHFDEVIIVTGHQHELIETALAGLPVGFVHAPDYAGGMGHSLAAGVRAAAPAAVGFAVIPGDLPFLSAPLIRKVMDCFLEKSAVCHIIPVADGQRGHPVILGAWLRPQLEKLTGEAGARFLLAIPEESARCVFLDVGDPTIQRDVDRAPGNTPG